MQTKFGKKMTISLRIILPLRLLALLLWITATTLAFVVSGYVISPIGPRFIKNSERLSVQPQRSSTLHFTSITNSGKLCGMTSSSTENTLRNEVEVSLISLPSQIISRSLIWIVATIATMIMMMSFGEQPSLATSSTIAASTSTSTIAASTGNSNNNNPFIYTNDYSDPLHPLCERHIVVNDNGKTFHYSGTAVGPKGDPILRGCSPEEIQLYKLRQGSFDGFILTNDGNKISAGDGIHEGIWESANTVDPSIPYATVDGIRWNDGNKWLVLPK